MNDSNTLANDLQNELREAGKYLLELQDQLSQTRAQLDEAIDLLNSAKKYIPVICNQTEHDDRCAVESFLSRVTKEKGATNE